MVATRNTFRSDTPGPISGDDFLDQVSDNTKVLFDMSTIRLSAVGGTADDVTATVDPPLDGDGIVTGMKFTIQWAATNTGPMTLSVNGETPRPVLDHEGLAISPGAVTSSVYSLLVATGANYRILSPLLAGASGAGARFYEVFTTSGTWTKPSGLDDDTMVTVEVIGGGGGGALSLSGGGGGGSAIGRFRVADLPATVAVTIGAGGAVGAIGGNTTFGTLLTGYGGGSSATGAQGGGGGGELSAGALTGGISGAVGGGAGATNAAGEHARTIYGGGGGAQSTGAVRNGGSAVHGGGGGAAGPAGATGGISLFAGNGGSIGSAIGSAPGGGGAVNGAGARGEVRVWI